MCAFVGHLLSACCVQPIVQDAGQGRDDPARVIILKKRPISGRLQNQRVIVQFPKNTKNSEDRVIIPHRTIRESFLGEVVSVLATGKPGIAENPPWTRHMRETSFIPLLFWGENHDPPILGVSSRPESMLIL